MRLYIRQRIFSWTDSYGVYDETGEPRYEVRADLLSLTHRIRVFDKRTGQQLGAIQQKLLTLLPTFEIEINGRIMGTIRKKFTIFTQDYQVDYRGWEVEGNFLGWEYRVLDGNVEVMSISKDVFRWSDCYELQYANPANEMPGLLLVLAIDAANCTHND